jgi:hypothetical protein
VAPAGNARPMVCQHRALLVLDQVLNYLAQDG